MSRRDRMQVRFKIVTTDLPLLVFISALAAWPIVAVRAQEAPAAPKGSAHSIVRVRWLVEIGAESLTASPSAPDAARAPILVSVPGAAYVLAVEADGSLRKRVRLAADPAAPYGAAVTDTGLALADKQGTVSLWSLSTGGELHVRWRQSLGDRVTSVGWDGGDLVLVATWKGRLVALASTDGRSLWSVDLAGRAEAPAIVDGKDVFVATKAKTLFRLDASTGAVRWKAGLPGVALHPPTLFGQRPRLVLCGTWDGQLLAHDAASGRVQWSASLPAKLVGRPVALPELVAAVTADGAVHGYDPTGERRWTASGAAEGPAALLRQAPADAAPRLLSVSKVLVSLDLSTGARVTDYPLQAMEAIRRRFADAMLDGVKTYSESQKRAILDQEAFEISGPLFGPPRLSGRHLAFGTEDGWAYVFDAAALRPTGRYHAGQPVSAAPRLASGRGLAVAGEQVFGLALDTGKTLWKRTLGADPGRTAGDITVGVVAGGRVHALRAADGDLRWSLRGAFRSVAPPALGASGEESAEVPWLVDDGEGNLRALLPPGRLVGDPLPAGDVLTVLAASERSWVAATREGKVLGVSWEAAPARLVKAWERTFDEPILEVQVAGGRVAVRSAGSLSVFEESSPEPGWTMRLSREDRIQVLPHATAVLVLTADEIRVHDWASGESRHQSKVSSAAIGADLRGDSLRWLDRWGSAHRVDVRDGRTETTDLGVPLADAVPAPGGFLVATAAGEVGFVEALDARPAAARSTDARAESKGVSP